MRVVAGGRQKLGGDVRADTGQADERRRRLGGQGADPGLQPSGLVVLEPDAPSELLERPTGLALHVVAVAVAPAAGPGELVGEAQATHPLSYRLGGADQERLELVDRPGAVLHCAVVDHLERPDGLDEPVTGLGR